MTPHMLANSTYKEERQKILQSREKKKRKKVNVDFSYCITTSVTPPWVEADWIPPSKKIQERRRKGEEKEEKKIRKNRRGGEAPS